MALEVSSWRDLVLLCLFTVPMVGILSILVYRIRVMGYIDGLTAAICYAAIKVVVVYQVWLAIKINVPILKKGVPKDNHYPFASVAALNTTYFAHFGAELAVVSMLPLFFQETWGLNPVTRGKGGFVGASWDEATEIVAAANAYTAKTYGPRSWTCTGSTSCTSSSG